MSDLLEALRAAKGALLEANRNGYTNGFDALKRINDALAATGPILFNGTPVEQMNMTMLWDFLDEETKFGGTELKRVWTELVHRHAAAAPVADRHELQAEGKHPAPCARHCEAKAYEIEIRNLKAQLAAPVAAPIKGAFLNEYGGVTLCKPGSESASSGFKSYLYAAPVAAPVQTGQVYESGCYTPRGQPAPVAAPDDAAERKHAAVVWDAIAYHDCKWPESLYSGVMFFKGETIRKEEFEAERLKRYGA